MAVIGSATLNIVPKVQGGLANYINGEITKANVSAKGQQAGSSFMDGFSSGAGIGIWSTIASRAIGVVTDSLGAAASRVDTLNNYPRIMQSLGVETDVANRSIAKMSDELQNVPTKLDDMANTVQGLYAATSRYGLSLDTVTDAGLALNSMLLAGGQSQAVVNSAMEQFRQMVSKGKPELQDWKSLIQAAPGQLNQLAQEMLGATATADDLYAALGGGKESDYEGAFEWGSLGMDEFVTRFAQLKDKFASDAEDAQGGIQTAYANMQNAITRGVAGMLEAFGQDRIASAIGDVKRMINDGFKGLQTAAASAAPTLSRLWDNLSPAIPTIVSAAAGFMALKTGISAVQAVGSGITGLFTKISTTALDVATSTGLGAKATALLGESFNPVALGVGAAAIGIGVLAYNMYDAWKKENDFQTGLQGVMQSARLASEQLQTGAADVTAYGRSMVVAQPSVENLTNAMQDYVSKTESIRTSATEQINMLGQYKAVIDECAGAQEVSADKAAMLQWALDGLAEATGETFTAEQVLTGQYQDEQGEIHNTVEAIDALIAKKQEEARMNALASSLEEAYKLQTTAATELARAEANYYQKHDQWISDYIASGGDAANADKAFEASHEELMSSLGKAKSTYNQATNEVESYKQQMGEAAVATQNADDATLNWLVSNERAGASARELYGGVETLASAFDGAGISAEQLQAIGVENFAQLAAACGGDIDQMIAAVQEWDGTPLNDKSNTITTEKSSLVDAEGHVYYFNGQTLFDKNNQVVTNKVSLVDAEGHVLYWNGMTLQSKQSSATVTGNAVNGSAETGVRNTDAAVGSMRSNTVTAQVNGNAKDSSTASNIWNTVGAISGLYSKTVDVVTNTINNIITNKNAEGGFRTHADGGFRYHAPGAIVNVPTKGYPLDLVGEDGAEAIVPLTNRKYAQPFIDMLVEGVTGAMTGKAKEGPTQVFNIKTDNPELAAHVVANRQRQAYR